MSIQNQYNNTNVQTIYDGVGGLYKKFITDTVSEFNKVWYNLDTAAGVALDMWGKFIGFPRSIGTAEKGYYLTLTDEQYKLFLRLKVLQFRSNATISEINFYMSMLFKPFGGTAYVEDNRKMKFITYIFGFEIPDWLRFAFANYDLLPHPGGVGTAVRDPSDKPTIFGFAGQGDTVDNFNRAPFTSEIWTPSISNTKITE